MALTKLGKNNTTELIAQIGDSITGDDHGMLVGKIKYIFGSASDAWNQRPIRGTAYAGDLPGYNGTFSDASSAVRARGDMAEIDVDYLGVDPKFVLLPSKRNDLEIKQLNSTSATGFGALQDSLLSLSVPILHPILEYKFTSLTPTNVLGSYATSLPNAPTLSNYTFNLNQLDYTDPNITIDQKAVSGTGELITINPDGTCTVTDYPWSAVVTGIFNTGVIGTINFFNFIFTPDPNGWLCVKDDNESLAGGKVFKIDQTWKTQYIYSATQPGTWWNNSQQICQS